MKKVGKVKMGKNKLTLVECWARDGLTDEQIANNLGISKDTFYGYKKEHSDFSDVLKKEKKLLIMKLKMLYWKKR